MASLQLLLLALAVQLVAPSVDLEAKTPGGPGEVVQKGSLSHPVLVRRKREWIWNSLYVEEEKPAPIPYKIGQLKSSKRLEVKNFEIDGEGANTIFTVDHKGDLFVTRALDREEKNAYHLTARMYDGNRQLIEDSGEFVVQVTDINDNTPVFPRAYNGSVMERASVGTKVAEVRATDADDPTTANGEIRYSLVQDQAAFQIDSITGVISCKVSNLDRETRSQYVVVVKAQDMRGMSSGSTATTSVSITIFDINDNLASFVRRSYELQVPENHRVHEKIGTLELEDRDQLQNKEPIFSLPEDISKLFSVQRSSPTKDANLMLNKPLDFETTNSYVFNVDVTEDHGHLRGYADNKNSAVTSARVIIRVLDVDEPPVFTQPTYHFTVEEERIVNHIGTVTASDPDKAKKSIRYSIPDRDSAITINPQTGQLYSLRLLDRELEATHVFQVKAQEEPNGLESFVKVNITVKDINDNKPELVADEVFLCENDMAGTMIGIVRATDKDEQPASYRFSLASQSSNFSLRDYGNGSAALILTTGPFSLDDPKDHSVDVRISDGGSPLQTSITTLPIKACSCDSRRIYMKCNASARKMGLSAHALASILLCILTILVIVILFVLRKRYQKDSLAHMKNSGEIHEQLVTYDEEGGGEMDTNGYDVSILSSACHDGSLLRRPDHHQQHTALYAAVPEASLRRHQPPPQQPAACKGDMAVMIEMKKDEADHDHDGPPYDTLHIYRDEGAESLAESLSSLGSSSSGGSNLDYDFLSDWGPRFRTLAELYGLEQQQ